MIFSIAAIIFMAIAVLSACGIFNRLPPVALICTEDLFEPIAVGVLAIIISRFFSFSFISALVRTALFSRALAFGIFYELTLPAPSAIMSALVAVCLKINMARLLMSYRENHVFEAYKREISD